MRCAAEVHGDPVEHLSLGFSSPFQQNCIIGCQCFDRASHTVNAVFAVIGDRFDPREQHYQRSILDHQRLAIHAGRTAIANHASDDRKAAVVHRWIQRALENQPLFIQVVADIGRCIDHRSDGSPSRAPRPDCQSLHRDPNVQRLSLRGCEPLNHDIIGPRHEGATDPLAMIVAPVDFQLRAFEVQGAQVILHRRRPGILQAHRE